MVFFICIYCNFIITFVTMSDKSKESAKELEETKAKAKDPQLKQAIEEKQKYVNKPICK